MNLEELLDKIEKEFPWQRGWIWLLRKDDANGGYFANIIKERETLKRIRFPAFGPTKILALTQAFDQAMAYKKSLTIK